MQVTTSAEWIDARVGGESSDGNHLQSVNVRFDPGAAIPVGWTGTIAIHTSLPHSDPVEVEMEVTSDSSGDVAADSVLPSQ